jgi:hypothetical protein
MLASNPVGPAVDAFGFSSIMLSRLSRKRKEDLAPGVCPMMDQRIEHALRSTEPVNELRALVLSLMAEGQSQDAILQIFEGAPGVAPGGP